MENEKKRASEKNPEKDIVLLRRPKKVGLKTILVDDETHKIIRELCENSGLNSAELMEILVKYSAKRLKIVG